MKELSMIISCGGDYQGIKAYFDEVMGLFKEVDIELIILNTSENSATVDALERIEHACPDDIVIVNLESGCTDDELFEIGLEYAQSGCFIYLHMGEELTPELFDSLLYDEALIDANMFRFLHTKYVYILKSHGIGKFQYFQKNERACLTDKEENAGAIDLHYFFQDIYVANRVYRAGIDHIYDIGSRIDGYISHLLSMDIKVTMIDIRPLQYKVEGLDFIQGNATELSNMRDGTVQYLSCLHALEHFGLGRYGDPVDPDAWKKALDQYVRVLCNGSYLFLSVPVGKCERVEFNAHRVFSPQSIIDQVGGRLHIEEFTFFHNGERTTYDMSRASEKEIKEVVEYINNHMIGSYDCGIFVFKKG